MKRITSIDELKDFNNYLIQHLPEMYSASEDFQVFVKLISQAYYLDYVIIKDFVDNIDVDTCPDNFLPFLGSLLGYKFRGDLTFEEQRVIIKSLFFKYKVRGGIDSILRFCLYGGDLDYSLVYKRNIEDIFYEESKDLIYKYNCAAYSSKYKFNDFNTYRAGVYFLIFYNKRYDSSQLPSVQPAGTQAWLFNYLEADIINTAPPESYVSIYLDNEGIPESEITLNVDEMSIGLNNLKFNFLSESLMLGLNSFSNEDFKYNGLYLCDNLFTSNTTLPEFELYHDFYDVMDKIFRGDEIKSYFDVSNKFLIMWDRLLDDGYRVSETFPASFFSQGIQEDIHFEELNNRIYSFYELAMSGTSEIILQKLKSFVSNKFSIKNTQFLSEDPDYYASLLTQDYFRYNKKYLPYHYDYSHPFEGILYKDYEFMEYLMKYSGTDSDDDLYFKKRMEDLIDSSKLRPAFINLYKKCYEIDNYNYLSSSRNGLVWNYMGKELENSENYLLNNYGYDSFILENISINNSGSLSLNMINMYDCEIVSTVI